MENEMEIGIYRVYRGICSEGFCIGCQMTEKPEEDSPQHVDQTLDS